MHGVVQYGRQIAIGALAIGYALLAHYTNIHPRNEMLGTLLALSPIVIAVTAMAWHTRHRKATLAAVAFGCAILAMAWSQLEPHFQWIYLTEHVGTQLVLCAAFGRTLSEGREPMCSYLARMIHGPLTPPLLRYTRRITIAWMVFFGLMAATSLILFLAAPLAIWSVFVNFFTGPLIVLMFVIEYGARRLVFPDVEHVHILATVTAMRKTSVGHASE